MVKRLTRVVPVAVACGLALPVSAAAAPSTSAVTGNVTGSNLSVSTTATPSFAANLDNGDSTPTYTVPLSVQDTRGTGAGWNVTITSTPFTTGGKSPYTLATNASTVSGVTAACASGTCTSPTNAITYPLAVPAGSPTPTAVKLFDAAANTGMGTFTLTPTVGVLVPQNSYAGAYTSTLTLAIVSGP